MTPREQAVHAMQSIMEQMGIQWGGSTISAGEGLAAALDALKALGWRPVGAEEAVVPRVLNATMLNSAIQTAYPDGCNLSETIWLGNAVNAALAAAEAGKREKGDG